MHFIIALWEGAPPPPDRDRLEREVEAIVRTWIDALGDELAQIYDPATARTLLERYGDAFSQGYREAYAPLDAVADIRRIEGLSPDRPLAVDFGVGGVAQPQLDAGGDLILQRRPELRPARC